MQYNTFQEGMVAWLPSSAINESSSLAYQRHMSVGAVNHPCLIIQLDDSRSNALCLQMTSFTRYNKSSEGQDIKSGNLTITEKFPHDSNLRKHYLPVSQGNSLPHDGLPALVLANGMLMGSQSYVKLDGFFSIELGNLSQYKSNNMILTEHSMCDLMHHFNNFLEGALPRIRSAAHIVSPRWDMEWKPELTIDNRLRAEKGELFATGKSQDDSGKTMPAIPSAYKSPAFLAPVDPIQRYPTPPYEAQMYEAPMYGAPMYDTRMYGATACESSTYGPLAYDASAYNASAYNAQAYHAQAYTTPAYIAPYNAPAYGAPLTGAWSATDWRSGQRPTAYRSASASSYGSSVNGEVGDW